MKQALRDALDDRGYTTLTAVQEAVLAEDLAGRDLLVSAQTGSGKTLGFGLAMAPTLLGEAEVFERAGAPLALVIAPTRELALQVQRELGWLYAKAGAQMASCVGGMDMRDERRKLTRGAHIVAATPGRLKDHIQRGSIDLSDVRAIVLDEADEMLDLGFREDLEFILGEAPQERQTLMFSATVPKTIAGLAKTYQRDAQRVVAKSSASQHADIEYRAMMVADRDADKAVINTLLLHQAPNAIVFANTRASVNRLAARLSNRGFQAVALSGELSQTERTHALQAMRDGRAQVCVATDVAARGIDLPKLDLVIHAELPTGHETLLHRSGRTGRAGRKGVSALVVTRKTRKKAERILAQAKVTAEWGGAPTAEEVTARDEARLFEDRAWGEAVDPSLEALSARLVEAFSAEQVAAAYLRLRRSLRSAPEELSEVDAAPAQRRPFGPSVWFSVKGGRKTGDDPRRLLPMICKAAGLDRDQVGAIRVQPRESFFEIAAPSADVFVAALGSEMVLDTGAPVTRLAAAPALEPMERGGPKRHKPRPQSGFEGRAKPHRKTRPDSVGETASTAGSAPKSVPDQDVRKPKTGPKGPPPPPGKSSSKKNRARAAAAKALKSKAKKARGRPT